MQKKLRIVIRTEIVILFALIFLFLVPLKFISVDNPSIMVDVYTALSVATILACHVWYIYPKRKYHIHNRLVYWLGTVIVLYMASVWITKPTMRTLGFNDLEEGQILGPLVISLTVSIAQLIVNLISVEGRSSE